MQELGKALGHELQEAREQKGLSLEEVQQTTKIRTRYLEAIESGRLDTLPGMVYARGFIKSYAEFLGINGQELLERHQLAAEVEKGTPEPAASERRKQPKVQADKPAFSLFSSRVPQVAALIGVLAVATAGYLYFANQTEEHGAVNQEPKVQGENETPVADVKPDAQPAPQPQPEPAPEPPKPKVTVTQKPQQPNPNMTAYTVAGTEQMELVFTAVSGDCWVDAKADGKTVMTGIIKKGEKKVWTANQNLTVLTGNSKGVTMTINGEAVTFTPQLRGYTYQFTK